MAAQHQVAGRRIHDAAMKTDDSNIQGFGSKHASNKYSDPGHFQAASPTGSGDDFHDSGLFLDYDQPIQSGNNYEDFVLLDDGAPFIDEEDASMIANHGSTYNGGNNEQTAQIQKYTSFSYDETPVTSFREAETGAIEAGVKETVEFNRPTQQDGPSLFANFQATSGPSMLSRWATTDHRHEIIAYRFEQPPYPTDRLQTPPPSSPPAKRCRTQSGKGRRRR
jgi:hypothetical protein